MDRLNLSHQQYSMIFNYFYWFLILNINFAIANILLIFAIIFLQMVPSNSIYFFLSMIPMGPAIAAMLGSVEKIATEKDINVFKDYWKFYKAFFSKSLILWTLTLTLLFILALDFVYFIGKPLFPVISPIFIILGFLSLSMVVCGMVLIIKVKQSMKNIIVLSFYLSIKKIYITLLNALLVGLFIFLLVIKPFFALLIMPSLLFFFIFKNCRLAFQNYLEE